MRRADTSDEVGERGGAHGATKVPDVEIGARGG